jgi:hypothetical protein
MAYQGGIDYLDLGFDKADWEKDDIQPPWTRAGGARPKRAETSHNGARMELIARVRDFNVAGSRAQEVKLLYDTDRRRSDGARVQCVIIAKSKEDRADRADADRRHYVLIVEPTNRISGGEKIYERVGAGFMIGKFIERDKPGVQARIQ